MLSVCQQLQKLNDLMEASPDGRGEVKPSFSNEGLEDREGMHLQHQNEMSKNTGYGEDTGYQLLRMDEHEEVPLGSLEKWYSGDASGLLDQPCSSSHWLDFWT